MVVLETAPSEPNLLLELIALVCLTIFLAIARYLLIMPILREGCERLVYLEFRETRIFLPYFVQLLSSRTILRRSRISK